MADGGGSNSNSSGGNPAMSQQQLLQKQQQQLYLFQQYQQHHQQQQQQQQQQSQQQQQFQQLQQQQHQQQQAISRFPSNIDAHLRAPGFRNIHPPPVQQQQQQQVRPGGGMRPPQAPPPDIELALQDAVRICNPDVKRPFASLEDAIIRLLPYHVVSDYEAEEDDRILDSDTTGQIPSRLQQWDHNILAKIGEFTSTFEKQVLAFNIMSRKRAVGEFRSEERLMIEQALFQEEKQAIRDLQEELASREKAGRDAAQANMRMIMAQASQAEQARAEAQAQAHAEMLARGPMRASALGSHADEASGQEIGQEQGGNDEEMIHGWGNAQREEDDPSEDFLNDDNEPDNEEAGLQEEWNDGGELDLNTR